MSNVPNSWAIKKVDDYTEIITDYVANGSFASLKENVEYVDYSDYVLIRLTDYNSNFNGEFRYITKNSYDFLSKTKLYGGEIIISNVGANAGTVFKAPILDKKMSLGPNSITLKTFGNDDFYYYWFKSIYGQHALGTIITGSAQPKFNKTNFRDLLIPVPPIEEQDAIVKVIKVFDNKIENNNAIIANLEEQAQTIFKSWFVDFEPFQDEEFIESDIGLIPASFERLNLGELYKLRSGYAFKSKNWTNEGYPVIKIKDIQPPTINLDNMDYIKDIDVIKKAEVFKVIGGEIVMALTGATTGKIGIIPDINEAYVNQRVGLFLDSAESGYGYLYGLLNQEQFISKVIELAQGSAQANLSPRDVNNLLVPYNKNAYEKYNSLINPMMSHIALILNENQSLRETRDTLLPKLMSGEIRVEDTIEVEEM